MKQIIQIGNSVDDGKGDYLRNGGKKVNANFNEIYDKLGDNNTVFPAGSWKTWNANSGNLSIQWGDSYGVDTTTSTCQVILPKGTAADYGKVIRLRDVWNSWALRNVTLVSAKGDTIKGKTSDVLFRNLMDVELVYCSPGRWEYADNKLVNKITSSSAPTVNKREIEAKEGQTDFTDIFGEYEYNPSAVEVYHKGNVLFYGDKFSSKSDYGSIGPNNTIVALDGKTIKLRKACKLDDVVLVKTYTDDLSIHRSSFTHKSLRFIDVSENIPAIGNETIVTDLSAKKILSFFDDFRFTEADGQFNPNSTELLKNGVTLAPAGTAGLMSEGSADNLGDWDFVIENDIYRKIKLNFELKTNDIITVRWFNNDIGTLLSWEDIEDKASQLFVTTNPDQPLSVKNRLVYTDYADLNPCTVLTDPLEQSFNGISVLQMFDLLYPVGTIYKNAHNTANPRDYMGFGTWIKYAEGRALVGWSHDNDPNFGKYTGTCGELSSPGTKGGSADTILTKDNIPTLSSAKEFLMKNENGTILVGQCQVDPDDDGPGYSKYSETIVDVNTGTANSIPINNLQPYITVAVWVRVA